MYSKNSMSPKIITSAIKRYQKDDFAEVRAEIAVRLKDRVSKILRWLAKRTSNLLSGKISKWLLECADDVAASRIEKAKVKLGRAVLFIKQNKAVLGASAIALVSTITPIVVMLKNKQLLKEKMSSALTKAIQKGRLNYARNNKFEMIKKFIAGAHKVGGTPEVSLEKTQEKREYARVQNDFNEDRLGILKAIAIIKNPKSNEKELRRAESLINNSNNHSISSIEHPKYTGAVGIVTKKLFEGKLASLNGLKEKAFEMLKKRRSLKDCLPSTKRYNDALEGIRDKISQMLRALAKKCSSLASGKISKSLLKCASFVSAGKLEKAKIQFDKLMNYIKNNKAKSVYAAAWTVVMPFVPAISSKLIKGVYLNKASENKQSNPLQKIIKASENKQSNPLQKIIKTATNTPLKEMIERRRGIKGTEQSSFIESKIQKKLKELAIKSMLKTASDRVKYLNDPGNMSGRDISDPMRARLLKVMFKSRMFN